MIRHLERKPLTATAKAPLLIFLHGFGSHEADLFGLGEAFDPRFHVLSLRAPLTLGPTQYAWFTMRWEESGPIHDQVQAAEALRKVVGFLESEVPNFPVDPQQVYLVGFSQGAIVATSVLLTRPELVSGVVAWSGRTLPEVIPTAPGPLALQGKPVLVIHGTEDRVLPIQHGRVTAEALSKLPVKLTYREFSMGHEVNDQSLAATQEWVTRLLELLEFRP